MAAARREQRRLVDEVREVGADHPGVVAAIRPRSTSAPSGTPRACTSRIVSRPLRSGGCTATRRSKRPGRSSAGRARPAGSSRAITITLVDESKPSISVRIWFSVCSRSSLPPLKPATPGRARAADRVELVDEDDRRRGLPSPARRGRARARRRRRRSPRRTRTRTSRRTARPPRRRPRARAASCRCPAGRSAARRAGSARRAAGTCSGWRRKSTTSVSSSFASSIPATSAKVTRSPAGS